MAKIRPFGALRFTKTAGDISSLVCPPYDIISDDELKALLSKNPDNIVRLELPQGESAYSDAHDTLKSALCRGVLKTDDKESIYIYEEIFTAYGKEYSLKGFISLVRLTDFSAGIVLPHEETLSKAKEDRYKLMAHTGCNFSQVYSLYMDKEREVFSLIEKLSKRDADISFKTDDGITQNLWCIDDKDAILKICSLMADKKLYIADGHHRYETALKFSKENALDPSDDNEKVNYCMMMLVNIENDGLVVFPTHRIVHSLQNFDADKMLSQCAEYFDIQKITADDVDGALSQKQSEGKISFVFYAGKEYSLLTLKDLSVMDAILPDKSKAYRTLDVSVLHSLILERLFKIDKQNMANQVNLNYTRDKNEAVERVDSKTADCAFIINPTSVEQIRLVASAGEKMPQKSTYFYPKLITGLVMNKFSDKQ